MLIQNCLLQSAVRHNPNGEILYLCLKLLPLHVEQPNLFAKLCSPHALFLRYTFPIFIFIGQMKFHTTQPLSATANKWHCSYVWSNLAATVKQTSWEKLGQNSSIIICKIHLLLEWRTIDLKYFISLLLFWQSKCCRFLYSAHMCTHSY